jgi:cellobiose-specific phosphotransferase system component IIB
MKQVLVLGAGLSTSYLVAQLLEDAERQDWFVTKLLQGKPSVTTRGVRLYVST